MMEIPWGDLVALSPANISAGHLEKSLNIDQETETTETSFKKLTGWWYNGDLMVI